MSQVDPRVATIRRWTLFALAVGAAVVSGGWLGMLWLLPMLCPPGLIIGACCCIVYNDTFAADHTGTEWDTRAGSFTVSGGTLNTSSASALIVTVATLGASATGAYVSATINCATSADSGHLVLCYVDDSNFWYAELQPGGVNGTLKLYERAGGVDTQRGTTATLSGYTGGDMPVSLCMAPGVIVARAAGETTMYEATAAVATRAAGLGTGAGSSSVTFDNFSFEKHHLDDSACKSCRCADCNRCDGETACQYQVEIDCLDLTCVVLQNEIHCPSFGTGGGNCCFGVNDLPALCGMAGDAGTTLCLQFAPANYGVGVAAYEMYAVGEGPNIVDLSTTTNPVPPPCELEEYSVGDSYAGFSSPACDGICTSDDRAIVTRV